MPDLNDLYNEMVTDHSARPQNHHPMPDATAMLEGYNPLCGDRVTVYVKVEGGRLLDISFQSRGCSYSTASGSLMTEALKGRTVEESRALHKKFHEFVTGKSGEPDDAALEKLTKAFYFMPEKPLRVKCVTLPWHTLRSALDAQKGVVSTE
jgi:nitrogen fixation NifU-like protein